MSKIFISYRRKTGNILGQLLYYRLKEDGHDVFFDTESMKAGRFDLQIIEHIDSSDVFLALLTANALDKCCEEDDFVRLEISHAIQSKKKIIPVMTSEFIFPEKLPEEINTIRFYQGIRMDLEFAEAFFQKILAYIHEIDAPEKAHKYDLYEELDQRDKVLFPSNKDRNTDPEQKDDADKQVSEKNSSVYEPGEDDFPEDDINHRSFTILDPPNITTLCFQITTWIDTKAEKTDAYEFLTLLEGKKEPKEDGTLVRFFPVFTTGRAKNTRTELAFLSIKEKENEVILNGAEFMNGHLNVGRKPGIMKYTQHKPNIPDNIPLDSLVDMTDYQKQAAAKTQDYISPFSPEKLEWVFVDPETKTVVRPKMIQGEDGKPYLKLTIIANHTYITIKTEEISDDD